MQFENKASFFSHFKSCICTSVYCLLGHGADVKYVRKSDKTLLSLLIISVTIIVCFTLFSNEETRSIGMTQEINIKYDLCR